MPNAPLPLDLHVCFALYGASMEVGRLYGPALEALGLTYPQYLALCALHEAEACALGTLAARLGLEPSTVTPLVRRLERAGLVTRAHNPADERQVILRLTPEGQTRAREAGERLGALLGASGLGPERLGRLGAEARALRDVLSRTREGQGRPGSPA
jgi:MarR family transcriptional regulator, organic hydroperoxide resistance regulator